MYMYAINILYTKYILIPYTKLVIFIMIKVSIHAYNKQK